VIDTIAAPEALPTSANPLPLLGLLGLVSVCAGLMLRRTCTAPTSLSDKIRTDWAYVASLFVPWFRFVGALQS
jgi:hypothetical protein